MVDRVEMPFGPGLNVLTGETGAGKSVLVGALSIVLGGRGHSDSVRAGAKEAVVEALFDVPEGSVLAERLEGLGVQSSDGQLVVRRSVGRNARGRVHLNGQLATVSMLGQVLQGVVELTGQHEHVSLLDPDQHLEFLDTYGGHGRLRAKMLMVHERVRALETELASLAHDEADKARQEDYLQFAVDEIEGCGMQLGEVDDLTVERKRLRGVTELAQGLGSAEATIYSADGSAVEALGRVVRQMEHLVTLDEGLEVLTSEAAQTLACLEDLGHELGRYGANLEAQPERLLDVEDRLELIAKLCRKYGGSEAAVLQSGRTMRADLTRLQNQEQQQHELEGGLESALADRSAVAARLSTARAKAGRRLARAIQTELAALSLGGTRLEVQLEGIATPGGRGAERVELLFSANPGEPLRALRKSASGGELSRVLLAIKNVLAVGGGTVACHVFDEVDTGMGGAVAEVLGAKLKTVAASAQVIAVTHLPQVAAYADHHFVVSKSVDKGRTITQVRSLEEGARVDELARMVGGVKITDQTRGFAKELRDRGRRPGGRAIGPRPERTRRATLKPVANVALRVAT